jgi:hypothetical protein
MRKAFVPVAIATLLAAGLTTSVVSAQQLASTPPGVPGLVSNQALIQNTIDAFPNGGPPLRMQLAGMVEKDPNLASDLAKFIQANEGMTPAQKEAAELGLADALDKLGVVAFVGPLAPALLGVVAAGGAGAAGAAIATGNKSSTPATTQASPN